MFEMCQAGVSLLQIKFLHEALQSGAFERLNPKTALTIVEYFTTDKTYDDLAKENKVSSQAVQDRIFGGIKKMRKVLYKSNRTLQQEDPYPLEQIQKGKEKAEVFKTEKSKLRRSEALRTVARTEEGRRKRSEAGKKGAECGVKGGRPRKYRTEEERRIARKEYLKSYNREKRPLNQGKRQGDVFVANLKRSK